MLPLQFDVPSDKVTFVDPSGQDSTHSPLFLTYPVEHSEQLLPFWQVKQLLPQETQFYLFFGRIKYQLD